MGERTSRPAEAVVRVAPAVVETPAREQADVAGEPPQVKGEVARAADRTQRFDAFVFTRLNLPDAGPVGGLSEDQPRELCGLPLAAVEKLTVNWGNYRKYVNTFIVGENAAAELLSRKEIFEEVSAGLAALLKGEVEPKGPLRVWWSAATPGFANLPWELLAYEADGYTDGEVSFVRGLPPDKPVPKLPVGEKLRLAFIHEPSTTPAALAEALREIEGVELIDMTGHPLEALQEAIKKSYELIHIVSDGSTSLAYEGFLYLRCPDPGDSPTQTGKRFSRLLYRALLGTYQKLGPVLPTSWKESLSDKLYTKLNITTLSAPQLSALQRGSQLAVLSLSAPNTDDASADRIDGMFLSGVFNSFVCIGSSPLPMPNIVAQIGAGQAQSHGNFWRLFYTELARSLEVEKSVRAGLRHSPPPGMALFLRQQYRQTFKRQKARPAESVSLISAELQQSQETLQQLKGLEGSDLGEIVATFERRLSARQQELQEKLNPWLEDPEPGETEAGEAEEREARGAVTEQ